MALTKEQISQLKDQLYEQIKNLPESQKKEAESQIENLSDDAIGQMLESQKSEVKVFREIVSGKIPSKKISECAEAIAVLDIKPISKGHTVIIPKERITEINKISKIIGLFAEEVSQKLSERLNSKKIKIIQELKFGEAVINLIPLYSESELSLESERSNPTETELEKVLETIMKEPEVIEKKPVKKEPLKKLQGRVP